MQNENTDHDCSSRDVLTDLKPSTSSGRSVKSQYRSSARLAGSYNSYSSSDTRTSRFNDRPVMGSPMFAARDCFSKTDDSEAVVCLWDELNSTTKSTVSELDTSLESSTTSERIHEMKKIVTQKAKNHMESAKDLFERRIRRIHPNFFIENPSRKVPRFAPNELSLGSQLGEGEFGSVYEIESLTRQPMPLLDYNAILANEAQTRNPSDEFVLTSPGAPVGAKMTIPLATDLMLGSVNLDNFLQRRLEFLQEQQSNVSLLDKENAGGTDSSTQDDSKTDETVGMHPARRRIGLKVTDKKGQMIDRQNNVDDFESFDGYVVKVVRQDIHNERKKRVAAADMAAEAKLLSALSHPNIISIRGIMGYIEGSGNYGIIMDKLRSTLQDQIEEWAKATPTEDTKTAPEKPTSNWLLSRQDKDKKKHVFRQTKFFVERMEALVDVVEAMKYLHEKRIIFRDLKPENVGLTKDHYVLFDFGLSRELTDNDRAGYAPDQYRATALTGSRLFMAPEVATRKPYGFSADVYSFGILFWEVVSLKEVFPNLTMSKHYKLVILKGRRPESLEDVLPPELNDMMESAWDKNPSNRPTFASIGEILRQELERNESSNNNASSGLLNFNFFSDDNREGKDPTERSRGWGDYSPNSLKKFTKLESLLERKLERMLRISPKNSPAASPTP